MASVYLHVLKPTGVKNSGHPCHRKHGMTLSRSHGTKDPEIKQGIVPLVKSEAESDEGLGVRLRRLICGLLANQQ